MVDKATVENSRQVARVDGALRELNRLLVLDLAEEDLALHARIASIVRGSIGRDVPRGDDDFEFYGCWTNVLAMLLGRLIGQLYWPAPLVE